MHKSIQTDPSDIAPPVPLGEQAGKDGYGYTLAMCWSRGADHRAYNWCPSAWSHWTDDQVIAYLRGYHGAPAPYTRAPEPISFASLRLCLSHDYERIERLKEKLA